MKAMKKFGPRLIDEKQHRRGNQALDQANRQMDWLHQRRKRTERQSRDAGERRLQHNGERTKLKRDDAAEHRRKRPGGDISAKKVFLRSLMNRTNPKIRICERLLKKLKSQDCRIKKASLTLKKRPVPL